MVPTRGKWWRSQNSTSTIPTCQFYFLMALLTISPVSCCHSQMFVQHFTQKCAPECYPPYPPTQTASQRPTHASHACQWYKAKAWIHRFHPTDPLVEGESQNERIHQKLNDTMRAIRYSGLWFNGSCWRFLGENHLYLIGRLYCVNLWIMIIGWMKKNKDPVTLNPCCLLELDAGK